MRGVLRLVSYLGEHSDWVVESFVAFAAIEQIANFLSKPATKRFDNGHYANLTQFIVKTGADIDNNKRVLMSAPY